MEYPMTASLFSDGDLLRYSKNHVRYEIDMFFRAGVEVLQNNFPKTDPLMYKNALVESFATHLRNLLLFLYPYSPDGQDIISDHFFLVPVDDWKKKRPTETEAFRNARARASREVSHLTVSRRDGNGESKAWPILNLMKDINTVLKIFVDNASSKRLDPSVKTAVVTIDVKMRSLTSFEAITDVSTTTSLLNIINVTSATNVFESSSLPEPPFPKSPGRS
jgi:hypothetical protein